MPADEEALRGPVSDRRCRDIIWLVVFVVYLTGFVTLSSVIISKSDVYKLLHGKDKTGVHCGLGKDDSPQNRTNKYIYYPNIQADLKNDPLLRKAQGICVNKCPQQFDIVQDYVESKQWFVPLSTFSVANRCIPYATQNSTPGATLCAWPQCITENATEPSMPQQVCGLKLDGTDKYWFLSQPDWWYTWGWEHESASPELIQLRTSLAKMAEESKSIQESCQVVVHRSSNVEVQAREADLTVKVLTKYTGLAFRYAQDIWRARVQIFLLGLLGSLFLSLVISALFSYCVKLVLGLMVLVVFIVLIVADYLLFVQANIATGNTGRFILDRLSQHSAMVEDAAVDLSKFGLLQSNQTREMQAVYQGLAIALAIGIALLVCVCVAIRKNFSILVELLKEASRTVRQMPALLLFPFAGVASLTACTVFLVYTCLAVYTMEAEQGMPLLRLLGAQSPDDPNTFENAQKALMWIIIFSFLWIYFLHSAVFITTVAGAVSHWYFLGTGEDGGGRGCLLCKPVLISVARAFRYHLGSLAAGSLLLALVTFPRVVLEYISQQVQTAEDQNAALRCTIRATRCVLWCLEKCVQFITEYAYVEIAVTGSSFCQAARESFVLVAKYPVQVALDKVASSMLKGLACLLVPTAMAATSQFFIPKENWLPCAVVIIGLSYMVTRLSAGVYDVCISALFVAAMTDMERFDGRHASEDLRAAMGLPAKERTSVAAPMVELRLD